MKDFMTIVTIVFVLAAVVVGAFMLHRWFNYNLGYESQVQDTVCAMLKPEALREGACRD
jgi:hypothetical protein